MNIVYFAWVREQVGKSHEEVDPPAGITDVAGLIAWLATCSDGHAAALADLPRIRAAIDSRFVQMDAPIAGAREIALFPPVTGG